MMCDQYTKRKKRQSFFTLHVSSRNRIIVGRSGYSWFTSIVLPHVRHTHGAQELDILIQYTIRNHANSLRVPIDGRTCGSRHALSSSISSCRVTLSDNARTVSLQFRSRNKFSD